MAGLPLTPDPFAHLATMGGQDLQPCQAAVLDEVVALIPEIPA